MQATDSSAEQGSRAQNHWRDRIKVHPAADLFPMMTDAQLRELGKDIQKNGLQFPLIIDDDRRLVDGRNRLAALEAVGALEFGDDGEPCYRGPKGGNKRDVEYLCCAQDPYSYVISVNILRRHLTVDDKVKIAAELLKARPELSNRQVAEQVKLSHPTIGKVRADLEKAGTVETVTTIVGADGVAQPAHKPAKPKPKPAVEPSPSTGTESAQDLQPSPSPSSPPAAAPEPPAAAEATPESVVTEPAANHPGNAADAETIGPEYDALFATPCGRPLSEREEQEKALIAAWNACDYDMRADFVQGRVASLTPKRFVKFADWFDEYRKERNPDGTED